MLEPAIQLADFLEANEHISKDKRYEISWELRSLQWRCETYLRALKVAEAKLREQNNA